MPNLAQPYQSGISYLLFFNQALPVVTGFTIGLASGVPTNLTDGGEINPGSNYARQPYATGFGPWSYTNNSGLMYNNLQITFPIANAYWGWVSGVNIYANNTVNGVTQRIFWSSVSPAKEINVNDQFYTPVSGLSVQIH